MAGGDRAVLHGDTLLATDPSPIPDYDLPQVCR